MTYGYIDWYYDDILSKQLGFFVCMVGVYGVGTGEECGFLERHDHYHGGRDQQTAQT